MSAAVARATLVEGECSYPRNPPVALSASARQHRAILLCQAVPCGDIAIQAREIASVEDIPHRRLEVVVVERRALAPDVVGVWLQPTDNERLNWLPGQYLDVILEDGKHRPFLDRERPTRGWQDRTARSPRAGRWIHLMGV